MSLLKRLKEEGITARGAVDKTAPRTDSYWNLKFSLHQRVVEKLEQEISSDANNAEEREQAEKRIKEIIKEHLLEKGITLPRTEQQRLLQELLDEVFDLGPISPLLRDPTVS
ncbi:MAG TPA: type II secretion system protein E, partial [Peptococcaceae bacterium]|nr:type II secretion system protein E [Peptococcaceae bacterium]